MKGVGVSNSRVGGHGTQKLCIVRLDYCVGGGTRDAKPITDSPYGWGSVVAITLGVIGVGILLLVREQGLFSCELTLHLNGV
jgi:hypothetical protein